MQNTNQKRTNRMLLHAFNEMLGGPHMRDEFARLFDHLANPVFADKELTEAEYQFALQKMREELPAFKRFLLSFPAIPPDPSWLV
jgi:hypothetical protein